MTPLQILLEEWLFASQLYGDCHAWLNRDLDLIGGVFGNGIAMFEHALNNHAYNLVDVPDGLRLRRTPR